MGRTTKDRPSFSPGFLKLQRRHFRYLFCECGLSPDECLFYIELLAAAEWDGRYAGTLGNVDQARGPVREWSVRDIAHCCFTTEPTARRHLKRLQSKGLVKAYYVPDAQSSWPHRQVWQVQKYRAMIADDDADADE